MYEENKKSYYGKEIKLNDGEEIAPAIVVYENVIDDCEKIINFSLSNQEEWKDSILGPNEQSRVDKKFRNTKVLDASAGFANDIKWFEISQIIWRYANRYAFGYDIGFSSMENVQLLHYSTEEGFYKPHIDSGPGLQRIFSCLLYLNDVDEGGETYFNNFDVVVKPKAGRLVLFPANYAYKHEAKTPKSNDKFVLVTWFNPIY